MNFFIIVLFCSLSIYLIKSTIGLPNTVYAFSLNYSSHAIRQLLFHYMLRYIQVAIEANTEDNLTKFGDSFSVISSEYFDDWLNGHMVMEEPQIGYFHKLLS